MNIAERLKRLREQSGMSQQQVANRLGIGRTTYVKYETGDSKPTRKLNELAKLFNVSVDYLLKGTQKVDEAQYEGDEFFVKMAKKMAETDDGMKMIAIVLRKEFDKAAEWKEHIEFGIPIKVESKQIPIAIGVCNTPTGMGFEYTGKYISGGDEYAVGEFVAFCVNGDNAQANNLSDGEIAIAKLQEDIESGDLALVALDGKKLLLQRVTKFVGGLVLATAGEGYSPLILTNDDKNRVAIMGKIVELRRKV